MEDAISNLGIILNQPLAWLGLGVGLALGLIGNVFAHEPLLGGFLTAKQLPATVGEYIIVANAERLAAPAVEV